MSFAILVGVATSSHSNCLEPKVLNGELCVNVRGFERGNGSTIRRTSFVVGVKGKKCVVTDTGRQFWLHGNISASEME